MQKKYFFETAIFVNLSFRIVWIEKMWIFYLKNSPRSYKNGWRHFLAGDQTSSQQAQKILKNDEKMQKNEKTKKNFVKKSILKKFPPLDLPTHPLFWKKKQGFFLETRQRFPDRTIFKIKKKVLVYGPFFDQKFFLMTNFFRKFLLIMLVYCGAHEMSEKNKNVQIS